MERNYVTVTLCIITIITWTTLKKVCVQLPTSADNVTLLALLLNAVLQCTRRPPLSIDISCPPGPQQQTRRTLLQRSTDGTNRWTDR